MKSVKRLFKFYIDSNLHVGIAGASFTAASLNYTNVLESRLAPLFVFFSTVLGYHFIRVFENYDWDSDSVSKVLNKQTNLVKLLMLLSLAGVLYIGWLVGISQLWVLVPAALITFFYAIPFLKHKEQKFSFRSFPKLKLISIALAWAIVTVLFPLGYLSSESSVWILFVQRFFLIMVLVIPFDIRDMQSDALSLETLPQQIGIRNTKKIGMLFLLFFMLLSLLQNPLEAVNLITDSIIALLSLVFLLKSNPNQTTYFASFWVEAIPIFWLMLFWCIQFFI